jgi:hypothetical protein
MMVANSLLTRNMYRPINFRPFQRDHVPIQHANNINTIKGTQFTAREFRDFYADSGIEINYTLVSHAQSISQAG